MKYFFVVFLSSTLPACALVIPLDNHAPPLTVRARIAARFFATLRK